MIKCTWFSLLLLLIACYLIPWSRIDKTIPLKVRDFSPSTVYQATEETFGSDLIKNCSFHENNEMATCIKWYPAASFSCLNRTGIKWGGKFPLPVENFDIQWRIDDQPWEEGISAILPGNRYFYIDGSNCPSEGEKWCWRVRSCNDSLCSEWVEDPVNACRTY